MKLTFLQTGGTIDKDYPKVTKGWAFEIAEPAVNRILEKQSLPFEYEVFSVCKKDSQEITNDDRKMLFDCCQELKNNKIIITHGTDTMIETGQFLTKITDKLILLTGSMRPERFSNSDADMNIGVAIGAANVLEKGVFIIMNGLVIPIENATRNQETGQFLNTKSRTKA
jgi:L-asparaginase